MPSFATYARDILNLKLAQSVQLSFTHTYHYACLTLQKTLNEILIYESTISHLAVKWSYKMAQPLAEALIATDSVIGFAAFDDTRLSGNGGFGP